MQKIVFVILILFAGFLGKSQDIQVSVVNEKGRLLDNINVQLLRKEKIVDFKKTNTQGNVFFQVLEKGVFHLKFTSVYYKTKILEVDTEKENIFIVTLESQITEIEMIEIKSRPKVAVIKKDTVSFNVKAVADGTERTTEDLIKKIPGLDVNENGKVTYKGNTVGQILVEGNDFFGKNHKLSTQNISADMIEGIDLFKNFTTMNGSSSTALNLKLKENYKNKITGNVEGNYGSGNSYLLHTNLFRFSKSGNLAFVGDANSIAKNPVNNVDFYEMNSQDDSSRDTNIEVPSFLSNDDLVKSKLNQFGALQYSKSDKKFSITAFTVFNNAQLSKSSTTNRIAFDGQPKDFNFFENRLESNQGFLGTMQIKAKRIFHDNSFLFFNFGYNPTQDHFNQNIDRLSSESQTFEIHNTVKNTRFNTNLSWNKQINLFNIIFSLKHSNESYNESLGIYSDKNLFLRNYNSIIQTQNINSNLYDVGFHLKNKNKWVNFNFSSGLSYKKENSDLYELRSGDAEARLIESYDFSSNLNLYRQFGRFEISASLGSHFSDINNQNRDYSEKNFKLKFLPRSKFNTEFEIEYNSKYQLPRLKILYTGPFYTKNFNYSVNYTIKPDVLSKNEDYKLMWSRFNINKGNVTFLILTYNRTKPSFTTNVINYGIFSEIENRIGDYNHMWNMFLSNNQMMGKNLGLKSNITIAINKTHNFIDGSFNVSDIKNIEISQMLSSKFRDKPVQFDVGYTFNKSFFEQSLFESESYLENIKLSLGFRAAIRKEWIGNILGEYLIQKTNKNKSGNFLLGGKISYRKEKSNFEYNLLFNNVLHLRSFNYINSLTNQLGTEENLTTALRGYITGGLKLYF